MLLDLFFEIFVSVSKTIQGPFASCHIDVNSPVVLEEVGVGVVQCSSPSVPPAAWEFKAFTEVFGFKSGSLEVSPNISGT